MNVYGTAAEEFHNFALAHLRAQQTRQWLLDLDCSRGSHAQTLRSNATTRRCRSVVIAIAVLLCSAMCIAQSTFGSIRGVVQDVSGAAVPGAQVTLHSIDQNTDQTVTSDDAGNYVIENVKAGTYRLIAAHSGFADSQLDGITLTARQDLRFTLTMQIAAQTTTVQVTASATEINTENATLGDMKNTDALVQLPLNYRAATTSPVAALASSANVHRIARGTSLLAELPAT